MSDMRLERLLGDVLADIAAVRVPDQLGRDIARTTGHIRQRPRWLALIQAPPMRLPARVIAGSPTFRLVTILALTLALALALAGAVAVGASLLRSPDMAPTAELSIGVTKPGWAKSDGRDMSVFGTSGQLSRIDPDTDTVRASATIDPTWQDGGFAVDQTGVWIADSATDLVYRVDPATLQVVATIPVGTNPQGVAIDDGAVWITNHRGGSVSRIDEATNQVVATIPTGLVGASGPHAPGIGLGSVWTGVPNANAVFRIDQATNEVLATIVVPSQASACGDFAFSEQAVWMTSCADTDFMVRIDPTSNKAVATVDLGAGAINRS